MGMIRIVNLLTQNGGYGQGSRPEKATPKNVRDALRALAHMIAAEGFTSLALPRLATGVGELDWKDVWPYRAAAGDIGIPIFVYSEYHAGQQAGEPGLG